MWALQSRLESLPSSRAAGPHFLWRLSGQRDVRALGVEPGCVKAELAPHPCERQRYEQEPSALVLHRPDKALDNGNARRATFNNENGLLRGGQNTYLERLSA